MTWSGGNHTSNWEDGANWSSGAVPSNGDTINIDGSTVTWTKTGASLFGSSSTVYNFTNGSVVTLGNTTASGSAPSSNPRFDGAFNVGAGCTLNINAMFCYGTSQIDGTVNVYNIFDPGDNHTLSFGLTGVINYMPGSMNGVEGNGRTTTISAILNTGWLAADATFTLEKRYLIAGVEGGTFNTAIYQSWTLGNGTFTGNNGGILTSTADELTNTADSFGKYKLGHDAGGVYVQYVKSDKTIPEPATATLGMLGLASLMMRRRRA